MSKRADEVMSKTLRLVDAKASIQDALEEMTRLNIRHLLVVDAGGKLAGIISDRDIKRYTSPFATATSATERDKATLKLEVGRVMAKNVLHAKHTDSFKTVVEMMLQKKFSAVPICDEEKKPVGIITSTDVMRYLVGIL